MSTNENSVTTAPSGFAEVFDGSRRTVIAGIQYATLLACAGLRGVASAASFTAATLERTAVELATPDDNLGDRLRTEAMQVDAAFVTARAAGESTAQPACSQPTPIRPSAPTLSEAASSGSAPCPTSIAPASAARSARKGRRVPEPESSAGPAGRTPPQPTGPALAPVSGPAAIWPKPLEPPVVTAATRGAPSRRLRWATPLLHRCRLAVPRPSSASRNLHGRRHGYPRRLSARAYSVQPAESGHVRSTYAAPAAGKPQRPDSWRDSSPAVPASSSPPTPFPVARAPGVAPWPTGAGGFSLPAVAPPPPAFMPYPSAADEPPTTFPQGGPGVHNSSPPRPSTKQMEGET